MKIGNRQIGPGQPTYIIAELSANHGQNYEQAEAIIRAAREAGADAVKLQTYTPDTITLDCDGPEFRISSGSLWQGRRLYDLYGEAFTPWEWQPGLKRLAESLGMNCFSSPFDATAVDFLEKMDVPAYKVASFELVDLPLVRKIAATGKPTIISTGMASLEEIDEAVRTFRAGGGGDLALLKCNSGYPAPYEEMNLRTIPHMAAAFGVPVGLSDHTLGIAVPVASVAIGATIIEKHLTLSRATPGPDSAFSLEPEEFRAMVNSVRVAEKALGGVRYEPTSKEIDSKRYRRSLFVAQDMQPGDLFTENNVRSIRPSSGLSPRFLDIVLGRRASGAIKRGTPLNWSHLAS